MPDRFSGRATDAAPHGADGIIRHGATSFYGAPVVEDLTNLQADVIFLGVPIDVTTNDRPGARFGPGAVRDASMRYHSPFQNGWFDVERGEYILRGVRMADLGDADIRTVGILENFETITRAARRARSLGAFPVFVGGDHAITFPLVRAFDDQPLFIVQFDAHQDYTDEKYGVRYSHDNQMRRCHELPHVAGIATVGLRGVLEWVEPWEAAVRNGVHLVSAERVLREGADAVLDGIPLAGQRVYLTIDIDVLDPAGAPGTGYPEPGGLSYYHLRQLAMEVARRGRLVAFDMAEVNPVYDVSGVTQRIAARLILDVLSAAISSRE